ncbi:MAG: glycosyltransferase [Waddliaceae bacterium]
MATPIPMYVPTAEFPNIGFPHLKLGGWYNKLTYTLVQKLAQLFGIRYIKEWRQDHHLPPQARGMDQLHTSKGKHIPVLHAYSRHVAPVPSDWPSALWQLQDFLVAGSPPVYVGFGSMAGSNPRRLARVVIESLQQARIRGVITAGWGGLAVDRLPETMISVDDVPHDRLFPHMAAVIHHGGAGTTAAGLRSGCPTIICPFFGDQSFWGRRVHALGAGREPIPQKQLTVKKLADAIHKVTTNTEIRQNAKVLGEKIRLSGSLRYHHRR